MNVGVALLRDTDKTKPVWEVPTMEYGITESGGLSSQPIDIARKHLAVAIDGCLTADVAPEAIHELFLDALYQADIPLPPVADGPCVHCGAFLFAYTAEGWSNLVEEPCRRCGRYRW